jgi:eukaryotic-like serine/threonine-protein kinase
VTVNSLTPAARLSSALADRYRIERELGAGGMATVYLAADLKHDRKVAIKVLKPELAAVLGAERFVVEIKTTASLQHPHILPLFDSGTADGFLFYVMPYIQGETIREKLNRETQFGVDEAIRIAREVADALDYAHRHGIIHRDIKPENILLHDGRAMVMDFGIALAVSAAAGGRMTETGLSLGTPHYMSPEQATAEKEITPRSDVYSLASVLYEMLAGQPPHIGGAAQQIIMKIITAKAEPVTTFRQSVPEHVSDAILKSLEKLPADRFESAAKFSDALVNAPLTTAAGHRARGVTNARPSWRERAAIPALVLSAVFAVIAVASLLRVPAPAPLSRYQIQLPSGMGIAATNWTPLAVSPDGSKLVYMGETGRLFLKTRESLDPVELAGTETAFNPFFSHEGTHVGFFAGVAGSADIKVVNLSGGPPTTVTTGAGAPGAAFGYDGFIYFDASGIGPLRRVRETGGVAEDATVRDTTSGELQHNWPEPLPNGRGVLFVIDRAGPGVNVAATNDIAVVDLRTRKHKVLMRGVYARYTATGHILFVTSDGILMAVPFDQDRMELAGNAVALREGITVRRGGGGVDLAISKTGTLWYGMGRNAFRLEVAWLTRAGASTPVDSAWSGDFSYLALSPEGDRLAVSIVDATGEQIWVKGLSASRAPASKLTFGGVNQYPRWHPDGTRVLFIATFAANGNVQSVLANGTSSAPDTLVKEPGRVFMAAWSKDGRWIAYERFAPGTTRDVVAVRTGGDTDVVPIAATQFVERHASVSPDGRWVLYASTTTGRSEVYVRPFPNTSAGLYQVSSGGGQNPKWSRDGTEIFYVNGSNELARVAVGSGATFTFSDPRVLFSLAGVQDWDVAPGGQRFIVIRERATGLRPRLVVIENFFQELNAKAPRK